MHFVIAAGVLGMLYVGLFHTRLGQWFVIVPVLVISAIAHSAAPGSQGTIGIVLEYAALFLVLAVGLAKRNLDRVADEIGQLESDPSSIRAGGAALADHLERQGFQRAPEGWLHFPRLGWDCLAMRHGPIRAFMVSGARGPAIEFTTPFDDGHTLATSATARDPVPPTILRQCFPGEDADVLRTEHDRAVRWLRGLGHVPDETPLHELTERLLSEERAAATGIGRGVAGSVVREIRRKHLDVGTIIDRPDVVDRLQARRERPRDDVG